MTDRCEGCGVLERGVLFMETLENFRGHMMCGWCKTKWQKHEKIVGRTINLVEYRKGLPQKRGG